MKLCPCQVLTQVYQSIHHNRHYHDDRNECRSLQQNKICSQFSSPLTDPPTWISVRRIPLPAVLCEYEQKSMTLNDGSTRPALTGREGKANRSTTPQIWPGPLFKVHICQLVKSFTSSVRHQSVRPITPCILFSLLIWSIIEEH